MVGTPRAGLGHTAGMKTTVMNPVKAFTLFALGLAIAAMGIYVADADDAPGAAVIGMLLMAVGVVLGVRAARNRLPMWAARTALAGGVVVAAFAAFLTHGVVVTAPLFPQSQAVPSEVDVAVSGETSLDHESAARVGGDPRDGVGATVPPTVPPAVRSQAAEGAGRARLGPVGLRSAIQAGPARESYLFWGYPRASALSHHEPRDGRAFQLDC